MPIPKPNPLESKNNYMQRCMVNSTMVKEYPTVSQRYAVCIAKYEETNTTR